MSGLADFLCFWEKCGLVFMTQLFFICRLNRSTRIPKPGIFLDWLGISLYLAVLNYNNFNGGITMTYLLSRILLYGGIFVFSLATLKIEWKKCIVSVFLAFFLTHFIHRTIDWAAWRYLAVDTNLIQNRYFLRLLLGFLEAVLSMVPITLFLAFAGKEPLPDLSVRELGYVMLIGVPVFYYVEITYNIGFRESSAFMVLSHNAISLCSAVALTGLLQNARLKTKNMEVENLELLVQKQYEQMMKKQENSELILQNCHDLKKQLSALQSSDGSSIQKFRNQIEKTVDALDTSYDTGNRTLDIVLSERAQICRENEIRMIVLLDGHLFEFMEVWDICSVFANALDNAIEGSLTVQDPQKRIIQVKAKKEPLYLFLRISNYYEGTLNWQEGQLLTTKSDRALHGYGIKSIRHTAEKYGGTVNVETEEGHFILNIKFPVDFSSKSN